jgi:hypothetical protein
MKKIDINDDDEALEFAKKAASHFARRKNHISFTDGAIEGGCLFALRWGMNYDGVVVFRLDEDFEPINYLRLIARYCEESK